MEVELAESLSDDCGGSLNLDAALPSSNPESAPDNAGEPDEHDTHQHRAGAEGAVKAASPAASDEIKPYFLDFVEDWIEPVLVPQNWKFIDIDQRRRLTLTTTDFATELSAVYPSESLLKLGLFERVGDEVRPLALLRRDVALLVEIDQQAGTVDLSADNTPVPPHQTALHCSLERKPHDSAEPTQSLWVVESDEEVAILTGLSMPAVRSEGLEGLRKTDVQALFAGDRRTDADWRFDLTLVAFDIAKLEIGHRPASPA